MKTRLAALALIALIALTGCSAATDAASEDRAVEAATSSPEPLVAETTEPAEAEDPEAQFVAKFHEMRGEMAGESQISSATDDQLIASGWEACELIRSGTSPDAVRLVDGEQPNGADVYADSSALMNSALLTLCPELI